MPEASESAYKPSDFLVGVVDFFSVILPGALLTFSATTWLGNFKNAGAHPAV